MLLETRSLRKSGVIQKTAERITQYLSGLSSEVVKVSSRRVKSDLNCGDMPTQTWKHAVHEAIEENQGWGFEGSSFVRTVCAFEDVTAQAA